MILICTCKYKQLNSTKCVSISSTAVHILWCEGNSAILREKNEIWLKKVKLRRKKGKKSTKTYKNRKILYNF